MRTASRVLAIAMFAVAPVLAQQPTPPASTSLDQQAPPAQAPAPPATPRPGTPAPTVRPGVPIPPAPPGVPVAPQAPPAPPRTEIIPTQNVRVELTITDVSDRGVSAKKSVTMLVADGLNGRVRSSNNVRVDNNYQSISINVDASVKVRAEGRVQLSLNFEYTPDVNVTPQAAATTRPGSLSESLTVLVQDGKPTLVSQSADPATDRKVTVEVTATVVK